MGTVESNQKNQPLILRPRHVVGRSRLCHLRLDDLSISGEHAVVLWTGTYWELRDMGSLNGTHVDGKRLGAKERVRLSIGNELRFGHATEVWNVTDVRAPLPMVIEEASNDFRIIEDGLIAIPDEANPLATVFCNAKEEWFVETDGEAEPIFDSKQITVLNKHYTVALPETWDKTTSGSPPSVAAQKLGLCFSVSSDEEYVQLTVQMNDADIDLGARAHHYVLLTLARTRLKDIEQEVSNESQGWVYFDEFAKGLAMDETHVNVAIYRCRQQMSRAGISGAADVIERRRLTRQIRLGIDTIQIAQL